MKKPPQLLLLTVASVTVVAVSAYAAKPIKVCGTKREPTSTYLDCYDHLSNIHQLRALEKFTTLRKLMISPQRKRTLNDEGMKYLAPLSDTLQDLSLMHQNIGSTGVAHLAGFAKLKTLSLYETKVDDGVFASLAKIPNLDDVNLGKTKITGEGFDALAGHDKLRVIRLRYTNVTDETLLKLAKVPNLEIIGVEDTHVTEEGIAKLHEQLPDVKVWH